MAKKFANLRSDIFKNKTFTEIELDTIEGRLTLSNLMGFDDDPPEPQKEEPQRKNINEYVQLTTTVKGGELVTNQQNTTEKHRRR